MSMNTQGRPTSAGDAGSTYTPKTFTGNRALDIEEPLIFEFGHFDTTGVDLDMPDDVELDLGGFARKDPLELPGLAEPEAMRHYVRMSRNNYAIDSGLYPLGSCTMKHNPRLNERMARLPGFADLHPMQPISTVQGALALMVQLCATRRSVSPAARRLLSDAGSNAR